MGHLVDLQELMLRAKLLSGVPEVVESARGSIEAIKEIVNTKGKNLDIDDWGRQIMVNDYIYRYASFSRKDG